MGPQERSVIAQDLEALSDKLRAEQATEEDIALQRARYFVDRDLISDALQEAYSFPNPSAELIKFRDELLSNVCGRNLPN
ncbi:hypothetical protein [Gloeocapsa sp. PCC 73106]|uniref:hypothetical protein n=1 Tax=Gloeocapsa sp. PCC 73106 TaxID=102232 RepID=UPI0002ABB7AB|nr:hypothetical protein [Gloeocapsa sp. PCC 73106]ELR96409.1 hypothetical protein GLO73106DRAFT_00002030 [Gloeocapsa sp. PCC 73106]